MNLNHLDRAVAFAVYFKFLGRFGPYPGADECWEYQGGLDKHRYGQHEDKRVKRGPIKAHRLMWCLVVGDLDDAVNVLHQCDNPPCCNPAHLYLGSQTDNLADMWSKQRGHVWGAKLTREQVAEIRSKWRPHDPHIANRLAEEYGVIPKTIRNIVRGVSWSFLGDASEIPEIRQSLVVCSRCGNKWLGTAKRSRCRQCGSFKVGSDK